MILKNIDGALLKEMVINGALLLERYKEDINALNVFPVPDGDTGTNMSFTMKGAVAQVNTAEVNGIDIMGEALSRGSLKGARGNSGVILSQIFRGFYNGFKGKITMDAKTLVHSLECGVETAYKAVMKPREGTILTVARAFAEAAAKKAEETDNIIEVFDAAMEYGKEILLKTPDMLDVLKKAGVVDAGGEGLLLIYQGFKAAMVGEEPVGDLSELNINTTADMYTPIEDDLEEITFGYCTEFFIINIYENVDTHDLDILKQKLSNLGDSIVVVGDTDLIKVHVHTDMPGKVLQYALRLGELDQTKVENMREQFKELHSTKRKSEPRKLNGIVAVTAGEGLATIFKDMGVDVIVEGGQTMNPSIDDIVKAAEETHAENVYVLPNNSNIIMAAQQAAEVVDFKMHVLKTKTSPQGISALLAYNPDSESDMTEDMTESFEDVVTGQVTFAVRDSSYDDLEIKEGDIMGLIDGKISVVGKTVHTVAKKMVKKMSEANEDAEIVTIYRGSDTKEKDADKLLVSLEKEYSDYEIDLQAGEQPLYYYIISLE